ncbi:hypothetical protein L914_21456, partial [Phytophthora nicotianae]
SSAGSENPKKKLLLSPTEREIIFDVANSSHLFTPSPQRGAVIEEDESDDEDPGDAVDGDSTLSLWGDFLHEVFEDEEIGPGYTENETFTSTAEPQVTDRLVEDELDNLIDEFECIPEAMKHTIPTFYDRNFPQEHKTLQGFRGLKATLAQLFS